MVLSIIIPSFNNKKFLDICLRSIFKETKKLAFETMVIDNASTDGTLELIKKNFPQVTLVENQENLGFAKACNQGAKKAKGKYLLFLNQDTEIKAKSLEKMIAFMEKDKKIGISGCKILDKKGKLQPSAGFLPRLSKVFFWAFFLDDFPVINKFLNPYHQNNKKFYNKEREVGWVSGAFLLVRKSVFEKIKGFDEKFFMYTEEVDFCYQVKKSGLKVFFTPQVFIVHKRDELSEGAILGEIKGLKYYFQKNKPSWEPPVLKILLKFLAFNRILVFGILKGDEKRQKLYKKAWALA